VLHGQRSVQQVLSVFVSYWELFWCVSLQQQTLTCCRAVKHPDRPVSFYHFASLCCVGVLFQGSMCRWCAHPCLCVSMRSVRAAKAHTVTQVVFFSIFVLLGFRVNGLLSHTLLGPSWGYMVVAHQQQLVCQDLKSSVSSIPSFSMMCHQTLGAC
jgi:hypothetical protein